ncbi:MAG: hypothetical protein V8Q82_09375 [Christensenellales bacterium]
MKKLLAILLVLCMVIPAAALGEEVVRSALHEPASGDSGAGGKQEMPGHAVRQQRAAHRGNRRGNLCR